jgi:glycosyltransferase involved in cell wall biosynthesis
MENSLISIIIPSYNGSIFLHKCFESILLQSYKNYEVILIDDGSTDETFQIVEKYSKLMKIIYFYQINSGQSSARNKGIELAIGKFITFLDSDDFIEQTYLELLYKNIKSNNSDFSFCNFKIYLNDEIIIQRKKFLKIYNKEQIKNFLLPSLFFKNENINHPISDISSVRTLFRRDFLIQNKIFFPKEKHLIEDLPFILKCYVKANVITFEDSTFYCYFRNSESVQRKLIYNYYDQLALLFINIDSVLFQSKLDFVKHYLFINKKFDFVLRGISQYFFFSKDTNVFKLTKQSIDQIKDKKLLFRDKESFLNLSLLKKTLYLSIHLNFAFPIVFYYKAIKFMLKYGIIKNKY